MKNAKEKDHLFFSSSSLCWKILTEVVCCIIAVQMHVIESKPILLQWEQQLRTWQIWLQRKAGGLCINNVAGDSVAVWGPVWSSDYRMTKKQKTVGSCCILCTKQYWVLKTLLIWIWRDGFCRALPHPAWCNVSTLLGWDLFCGSSLPRKW